MRFCEYRLLRYGQTVKRACREKSSNSGTARGKESRVPSPPRQHMENTGTPRRPRRHLAFQPVVAAESRVVVETVYVGGRCRELRQSKRRWVGCSCSSCCRRSS